MADTSDVAGDQLAAVAMHYGLVDVVQSSKMKCICPLHGDKNPSMSLDFDKGFYYCFGCGAYGDAEKLVKSIEKQNGLNDLQCCKRFNEIVKGTAGKPVVKRLSFEASRKLQRHYYEQAYDYYHGLAKVDWMSSDEPEVRRCRSYMLDRGFSPLVLAAAGAKVTYNDDYELVFPMVDNGKFRGWVCRTDKPEVESFRKYLYNKGFSRATTVVGTYGDSQKFSSELASKYVIIVEGYMDRLKLVQFGIENAVAILGWKMSAGQLKKLKDAGIEVVVSALDNDDCGRNGTEFLRKHFEVVRFKYLKGVKDPGEMELLEFKHMWDKTKRELGEVFRERQVNGNSQ